MEGSGGKRLEGLGFNSWLTAAIVVDVLSFFIPFIGSVFVMFARISFILGGYPGGITARMVTAFIAELIPGVNMLPACTYYIVSFKTANNRATSEQKNQEAYQPNY